MWYNKKKTRNLAERPKKDALSEQARLAIRARLAIMQFRRQRMNRDAITAEEEGRRKDLGIWSYGGGKKMGPLKPRSEVLDENDNSKKKVKNKNKQQKEVQSNELGSTDNGKKEKKVSLSEDVVEKDKNEKNIKKARPVLEKAEHNVSRDSNNSSPVKSNVPPIPLGNDVVDNDDGMNSKSSSDRSDRSVDFVSRDYSESPGGATGSEFSSQGRDSKRPGSSRKLFTVVTPAFHQSETRGSPSYKRKSMPADSQSIKSLGMSNNKSNKTDSDLPPRPKTSFQENTPSTGKLVGTALHSSPVKSNKETSGKLAAGSPVKVKPKTIGVGEAKGDSSRVASAAKAGAKSANH